MLESTIPTPCYLIDRARLKQNLEQLEAIRHRCGCKILFSQKAFASYPFYAMIARYLDGTASTSCYEAQLAHAYFRGENHVCQTAYRAEEMEMLCAICDHIVFNSPTQFRRFAGQAHANGCSVGLRVNPECPTQKYPEFDPCAPFSRLGTTLSSFPKADRKQINGLHVHALYEQNADALQAMVSTLVKQYAALLPDLEWVNLGGGQHLTREGYQTEVLEQCCQLLKSQYGVTVYLEPGEAIVWKAGYLLATVLDCVENGMPIAILDVSAVCHAPDVTELHYRPSVLGAGDAGERACTVRLAGCSCLPEDVFGDYSFDRPLCIGDRVVFEDMAINTITKASTYTGLPLPSIAVREPDGNCVMVRFFSFDDYKNRL